MKLISEGLPTWIDKSHTLSSNLYLSQAPLVSTANVFEKYKMVKFCSFVTLLTLLAFVQSKSIEKIDQGKGSLHLMTGSFHED